MTSSTRAPTTTAQHGIWWLLVGLGVAIVLLAVRGARYRTPGP